MDHNNHSESNVKMLLRGEENRFFLTHATDPVVLTGGGRSG
jgi:hypothetical protein